MGRRRKEEQVGTQEPLKECERECTRVPKTGEWVTFWKWRGPDLPPTAYPAQVIMPHPSGGMNVNVHELGIIHANLNTPYYDTPKIGHWSFVEETVPLEPPKPVEASTEEVPQEELEQNELPQVEPSPQEVQW